MDRTETVWLFSYGTLRQPEVQQALFGRHILGEPDTLPGFIIEWLSISDQNVVKTSGKAIHPMLRRSTAPDAEVPGAAFAITREELAVADAYEVADYARVTVTLTSGRQAFAYIDAAEV